MTNKSTYAQFFTPTHVAKVMSDLCKNEGRFLEPACGNGALVEYLTNTGQRGFREGVSIELDPTVAPDYATVMDFFEYPLSEKFSTVISNPPYLSHKAIPESTRNLALFKELESRLGGLANLYSYFILKSMLHLEPNGEYVAIVPDDAFRTTSNFKLFDFMHKRGTFSDIIRFRKSPFLPEVAQPVLIFRYVLGDMSYQTNVRVL